jgi:hypothetical protein
MSCALMYAAWMLEIPRRRFLAGLIGLIAAPAIVRVTSLMPIKAAPPVLVLPPVAIVRPDSSVTMLWGDVVAVRYDYRGNEVVNHFIHEDARRMMGETLSRPCALS